LIGANSGTDEFIGRLTDKAVEGAHLPNYGIALLFKSSENGTIDLVPELNIMIKAGQFPF
jgi:hypothetical protein